MSSCTIPPLHTGNTTVPTGNRISPSASTMLLFRDLDVPIYDLDALICDLDASIRNPDIPIHDLNIAVKMGIFLPFGNGMSRSAATKSGSITDSLLSTSANSSFQRQKIALCERNMHVRERKIEVKSRFFELCICYRELRLRPAGG
jgi:hypothetical protein